jgi:hypothetical protein
MIKWAASSSTARQMSRSLSKAEQKAAIKVALEKLDEFVPQTPKMARLVTLLRSWLTDKSGYDKRTLPKLMKALDEDTTKGDTTKGTHLKSYESCD